MTASRKIYLILHLIAGGSLLAVAGAFALTQTRALQGSAVQIGFVAAGLVLMLIGLLPARPAYRTLSQGLCLSILTGLFLLGALETVCRLVRFDFVGEERAFRRLPLFYRWPVVPTGEVYFRRSGPEVWTGRPLKEICSILTVSPNVYQSEPQMTSRYDNLGFRNEDGFTDWDIVVAGDSMTEMGTLPYNELFTTIMSRSMNMRVLNRGTSNTGPLNQLSFLRDYGLAPSTKRAMIVFYEGNDLVDLNREYNDLMKYQKTGLRPYREFSRETSLLRTIYHTVSRRSKLNVKQRVRDLLVGQPPQGWITGYFKSKDGEVPITLRDTPPSREQIGSEGMQQLEYFFQQYQNFAQQHGIEIWSAFMPCKERVVSGMVRFVDDAPEEEKQWRPTDLPNVIAELASGHGVRFVDLTPALVRDTQTTQKLLFNSIYDCHLNAAGSQVVAAEMVRVLSISN
ncbi:MAG TPA: SGNH/GDSL hydrolase family protein [Chthoniobacterales bacterium]|nr:SGNH/GDSL hydrolase family protein [Chthoniobacterales bacterium]